MSALESEKMRCPVCGAVQVWSCTCRRCGADLQLLRGFARRRDALRQRLVESVRQGRSHEALAAARELHAIEGSRRSRRAVAACAVACGRWDEAVALAPDPPPRAGGGDAVRAG